MYCVVGVRFKTAGKIYYFDPGDWPIKQEDYVIVETSRGVEYGKAVVGREHVGEEDVVLPLKKVKRIADERDMQAVENNRTAASEAHAVWHEKIEGHHLEMKLVDVEYTFDRNKLIFYFTSDGRVDFRLLVKDLASVFRTRIELRQIGVRDEAKMLGGIGPCGRVLCCSSWLGDFEPVSIKMAKDQNLSLNPSKISGLCGRLMCCLKYEHDQYESRAEDLPEIGDVVVTPDGKGNVNGLRLSERKVVVQLHEDGIVEEYASVDVVVEETETGNLMG